MLQERFGDTSPPNWVTSFSWRDPRLVIPGACALTFPPTSDRGHWLCLTHGLTQPLRPTAAGFQGVSGYGWEFGITTSQRADWAPYALYEILTYWKRTKRRIEVGHRVPMVFYDRKDGLRPLVRDIQPDDPYQPEGEVRALLFWPYLLHPGELVTSTGSFRLLIGATITQSEWAMAAATSSAHLLLLMVRARVYQTSDPKRNTLTTNPEWSQVWEEVRLLPQPTVERLLSEQR